MAAELLNATVSFGLPVPKEPAEEEKIWTSILSEVSSKANTNFQGGTVIILGENQSGKSTLLSKLDKSDKQSEASALEYHILHVQNDFRDTSYAYQLGSAGALGTAENLVLPVWTLDGEENFAPFLQFALPPSTPSKAVILLVASIDNTGLIHSIRRWANLLTQQINQKYEKSVVVEAKKAQERYWQEYCEPVECSMAGSVVGIEDTGLLPLEQGVLTENCGANLVVVLTKSDLVESLSDQQADRIMVQLRKLCLQLGAALIYTSANKLKNVQMLYKYMAHRAFGLPFTANAQLIERDIVFIPAGWDGERKIDIIKEGVPDVDLPLEPTREKPLIMKDHIVEAEDEQVFLQKLLAAAEGSAALAKKANPLEESTEATSSPLASFFSSLLKDKPATSVAQSPRGTTSNDDAQAQLERILKASGSNASSNA